MKTSILITSALALGVSGIAAGDDTIIVTGLKTQSPLQSLPSSVDVIDREDIEALAHQTLNEALEDVSGLQLVQSGPAGSQTSVFFRGSNSNHALTLLDGIRVNDPSTANGIFNFGSDLTGHAGRVEVIRGPLSALHGSDAIGGVINVLPRSAPDQGFGADVDFSWGGFNTLQALANLGYGGQKWRVNLTAQSLDTDGYNVTPDRMAYAGSENDGAESLALTFTGALDITDKITADILFRDRISEVEFDSFSAGPSFFQRGDDTDLYSQDDQQVWALGLSAAATEIFQTRLRAGQVLYDVAAYYNGAHSDVYDGERDFVLWQNRWQVSARHLLSFGGEWRSEAITTDTLYDDPLSVSEDIASAYAAIQSNVTEALSVTATARYDSYDDFDNPFTASIGAVYQFQPINTRLYASWGQSFKAPTLYQRFASSPFVTPSPFLEPEEAETVEIGFELSPLETVSLGAAVYQSDVENLIEGYFDFDTFTFINLNIGEADLEGYEAFLSWTPFKTVTVDLDYTYTDARNGETDARLLRRPAHNWSARASWSPIEIATLSLGWRYVGERLDVTYDDLGFWTSSNGRTDSYQLLDLAGTLNVSDSAELYLSVRNLTDETYEQPAAYAGAPRAVTLGVRWSR